jgi:hypothetical protein
MLKLYVLATVFGSAPSDLAGAAERFMQAQFGNVSMAQYPARLRVTEAEDLFLALTSYPSGERADEAQLAAFLADNGVLEVGKESGLFISRKAV